jgi:hypothetical protein
MSKVQAQQKAGVKRQLWHCEYSMGLEAGCYHSAKQSLPNYDLQK